MTFRPARVLYLHGFASSPASSKARRFARELGALGVPFDCPDLNEPAFATLTVTRMLEQATEALSQAPGGGVAVIGSSLGGFVALHAATDKIARLILLAPAVEFGGNRLRQLGEHGVAEWRRAGRVSVHHHAWNRPEEIEFSLIEDAAKYDAFARPSTVPTLVFQGRHDESVDPASVERWVSGQPHVDLRMLDDGHQLTASMDLIWEESRKFLGLEKS